MNISEEKVQLRKEIRSQRKKLDPELRKQWDKEIEDKIFTMDEYKNALIVFCFVSYGGEPETSGILRNILEQGKKLLVPRCRENGEMDAVRITSLDMLQKGSYGIMEPPVDLPDEGFENIDFAVVPALAFTENGERLGQGGGYYDRFMAKTKAFTCGICYPPFILERLPIDTFDMRVNKVIF